MGNYIPLTEMEHALLHQADESAPFRILQTSELEDYETLKASSQAIDPKASDLKKLISRMYATVTASDSEGVGIAAPQIGVNRNVFLVQRLDKPEHPFEYFINPEIVWYSKILRNGEEGCLSIAQTRGHVKRSYVIQITYCDFEGTHYQEVVEGFTAVIMQHEMDHLKGILFTDRIENQSVQEYFGANLQENLLYLK